MIYFGYLNLNHNHHFEKKKKQAKHLIYKQMCHLGDPPVIGFFVEENGDVGEEAFLAMGKKKHCFMKQHLRKVMKLDFLMI